jgi:Asp-tRNA(Asn)/Glu-tRNA(Gln) amidotransferase C subunit
MGHVQEIDMSKVERAPLTSATLQALAGAARLHVPEARREPVRSALDGIYALLDALDAVPVGETPPANAYDARWEVK